MSALLTRCNPQMALSDQERMGALLSGLERILYLVNRFTIYEKELYLLRPLPSPEALQQFCEGLTRLYTLILEFIARAIRTYDRNFVRRMTGAAFGQDDAVRFETRCLALEEQIEIEAENCERSRKRSMQDNLTTKIERLERLLKQLIEPSCLLFRIDRKVFDLWRRSDETKRTEILVWTSSIPYRDNHAIAAHGRTQDTGDWLLSHPTYQHWYQATESMILWLHGIRKSPSNVTLSWLLMSVLAGAGKTKLISKVVDSLLDPITLKSKEPTHAIAYFYCNRNHDPRRDIDNILRSFVKQLSISPGDDAIHKALADLYNKKSRDGFSSHTIEFAESENLLLQLMTAYQSVTLVLDALDECFESRRLELIELFNRLTEKISSPKSLKIIISSREDDDIKHQLEKKANVGIAATDNHDDIQKFVAEVVETNRPKRRYPLPRDLEQDIVSTLLTQSQGM
jgi:ankyrin repeat domain-containing protein 50